MWGFSMEIESDQIDDNITRIVLKGRLDLEGTHAIDMKFTAMAATRKAAVLVDLREVNFIASIGMRTLMSSAKAQAKRGGKTVLCNAQPMVREALETAGLNQVIPMFDDLKSARQALAGVV